MVVLEERLERKMMIKISLIGSLYSTREREEEEEAAGVIRPPAGE
jgi:hypothetical protein